MMRIERTTSPLPRECSTTEPHGQRKTFVALIDTTEGVSFRSHMQHFGAGEGNRTLVLSLEGFSSTIELRPPAYLFQQHNFSKILVDEVGFEPT
jgi:hypothetical protein